MYLESAICMALIISVASGLRSCPTDCSDLRDCQQAINLVSNNKSDAIVTLLIRARCGKNKICCSDFDLKTIFGFENHPNTYLLPRDCGNLLQDRVFGGEIAQLYDFPWVVLILYGMAEHPHFKCTGSLINSRYVLTAAHCFRQEKASFVRVGEYDINDEKYCCKNKNETCECYIQDINVSDTIMHPDYREDPVRQNDIALLRLANHVDLTVANAGTICLPIEHFSDEKLYGNFAVITGWGASNEKENSSKLKMARLPILTLEGCNNYREDHLEFKTQWQGKLCAGGNKHDACGGDSGGPLILDLLSNYTTSYNYIQFGIVSYGPKDCQSTPGVYTDVRKYMKWILDTIKP